MYLFINILITFFINILITVFSYSSQVFIPNEPLPMTLHLLSESYLLLSLSTPCLCIIV